MLIELNEQLNFINVELSGPIEKRKKAIGITLNPLEKLRYYLKELKNA